MPPLILCSCAMNDSANWEQSFKSYILGKVVVTQYNNFTYKIDDIDWVGSPLSTFECSGEQVVSHSFLELDA